MDKIKVIHDTVGHTLTVWFDEPSKERICGETTEEVVLMKNSEGHVIGFEWPHYQPVTDTKGLVVETVVRSEH